MAPWLLLSEHSQSAPRSTNRAWRRLALSLRLVPPAACRCTTPTHLCRALRPKVLAACVEGWVRAAVGSLRGKVLSFDGKALRGGQRRSAFPKALHKVHFWAHEQRLVLARTWSTGPPTTGARDATSWAHAPMETAEELTDVSRRRRRGLHRGVMRAGRRTRSAAHSHPTLWTHLSSATRSSSPCSAAPGSCSRSSCSSPSSPCRAPDAAGGSRAACASTASHRSPGTVTVRARDASTPPPSDALERRALRPRSSPSIPPRTEHDPSRRRVGAGRERPPGSTVSVRASRDRRDARPVALPRRPGVAGERRRAGRRGRSPTLPLREAVRAVAPVRSTEGRGDVDRIPGCTTPPAVPGRSSARRGAPAGTSARWSTGPAGPAARRATVRGGVPASARAFVPGCTRALGRLGAVQRCPVDLPI